MHFAHVQKRSLGAVSIMLACERELGTNSTSCVAFAGNPFMPSGLFYSTLWIDPFLMEGVSC